MIGQTLGHYRILEKLGEGGMGVVYKAIDLRLERPVALKVLPKGMMADEERRRRFAHEARAASALNHPNIVTIYEIDRVNGIDFIAMEFVEGKTLDARIGKAGMALDSALEIAAQVARAVAAAHAKGLIHRDLKPSNIIVSDAGVAKVLDFGLAKHVEQAPDPDEATRTESSPVTREGAVIGTAAYMSPEQAEGKKLDGRSDIFSFGTVLYEMLTGCRPFRGDSGVSTIAALLKEDPKPVTALVPRLPQEAARIVSRCLRKNPARRSQTMADLEVALTELREEAASGKIETSVVAAVPGPRRWPWVALACAGFLTAGVSMQWARGRMEPHSHYRFRQLTFDEGLTTDASISRDGRLVTYASDRAGNQDLDIFVQQVAGGNPIRLTADPADDLAPHLSPDGSQVVFQSQREGGGVYVVPAFGGEARLLVKGGKFPQFSPDGKWVVYQVGDQLRESSIYVIAANGGEGKKVETGVPHAERPVWSPDGRRLLFAGAMEGRAVDDWFSAPAEGGPAVAVNLPAAMRRSYPAQWIADETVATATDYGRRSGLSVQAIRLGTDFRFASMFTLASGSGWASRFSSDLSGLRVVLASYQPDMQIWSIPVKADEGRVLGSPVQVTFGPGRNSYPTVSPSRGLLAFYSTRSGRFGTWLLNLATGTQRQASPPEESGRGELSPDGERIAYPRRSRLFTIGTRGGAERMVCEQCLTSTILGWTPDSRKVITTRGRPLELVLIDVESGQVEPLLRHPKWDLHRGQVSPAGDWLAFNTKEQLRSVIRVARPRDGRAAPEPEWIEIASGTDMEDGSPTWAPNGNLLYFHSSRSGPMAIWAQALDAATKRPKGAPVMVVRPASSRRPLLPSPSKAVTPDHLYWAMEETKGNIWIGEQN